METYKFDLFALTSKVYESAKVSVVGLSTRRIAQDKFYDPEDLASQLVIWLFDKQDYLAQMAGQARNPDSYIATAINNKAKDIVNAWATDEYCNNDRYIYSREFVKVKKLDILSEIYPPDSLSHTVQCDMLIALDGLSERQRHAFLTTKHDDSPDESQRRRDAAMRSKAERLVWQNMNSYAYARTYSKGGVLVD